jgi:methane/ammonia monooxygenase subunit C
MAMTAKATTIDGRPARREGGINYRLLAGGMLTLSGIFVSVRLYQQFFAWTVGLDSTTPEFQTHWMRLLYAEFVAEGLAAAAIWGWLWKTRDRNLAALEPSEEIRRYLRLIGWLLMYVFAVYWAEFFAEQDATWHQTVVRDTEFTPSHIPLFFGAMPVFIIMGVSSYLYARTRIPQFARGHSVPFLIAVAGPFMMLPNVGFNEWGHTFWIMEEIFSAPLHAGFVVFAWAALCLGGILMQGIPRIVELAQGEAQRAAIRPVSS